MKVNINGTEINYHIRGEGLPFIMLHGYRLFGEAMLKGFEPVFENRPDFQRIYPDLPAMGHSTRAESITSSDDYLDVMCEFIDTVIPDKPFLIGGFSYGGLIARGIMQRFPERTQGLFMMSPVINALNSNRDLPEFRLIIEDAEAVAMIPEPYRPIVLSATSVVTKPVIERIMDEIAPAFQLGDHEFLTEMRQSEQFAFSFDVDKWDEPFDKPVLILTGKQDSAVGFADAFQNSRLFPRATYVVLDRCGHGPHLEQPALFKALTGEWLDRVFESMRIATVTA